MIPAKGGDHDKGAKVAPPGGFGQAERPRPGGPREGRASVLGTAGSPAQGCALHGDKGFPRPSCACGSVQAIAEIIDPATGQIVGAQYQWNTGERRLEWFGEKVAHYRLRPLEGQGEAVPRVMV